MKQTQAKETDTWQWSEYIEIPIAPYDTPELADEPAAARLPAVVDALRDSAATLWDILTQPHVW